MTTYNLPTGIKFRASRFGLFAPTKEHVSPLTGSVETLELAGYRWRATFECSPKKRVDAAPWCSFLAKLKGRSGRFYGYDPAATSPQGTGNGTPLVKGASQTGESLETDGWANNETVLKDGDYFEVNGELKICTADVASDGSGNATIAFTPPLRSSPADNAPITVDNPKVTMGLVSDDQAAWDVDTALFFGIRFEAEERF